MGLDADGRLLALNSYENRVYQVGVEDATPVVVKFYRPQRWSAAALQEEHDFAHELQAADIPVVAPERFDGRTLLQWQSFHFAIYRRQGGRWPELNHADDWRWLGRFLGRIHSVGRRRSFAHRVTLSIEEWADRSRRFLMSGDWLPSHLHSAYRSITDDLLERMKRQWSMIEFRSLRLHGDCHPGNVLWIESEGPHFVDLDDCMMGPAVQDIWMLLSGPPAEQAQQLHDLLDGYGQFADFDWSELALIETLRTLRLMHYAAWLARRWEDPAFPRAFPWFGDHKYWERHVLDLREQLAALDEPPLNAVV